jgi:hypothetical protein
MPAPPDLTGVYLSLEPWPLLLLTLKSKLLEAAGERDCLVLEFAVLFLLLNLLWYSSSTSLKSPTTTFAESTSFLC